MSYPDPTQPPHQFIPPPFSGGDATGLWHNQNPDSQFGRSPFKRPKITDNPSNFTPMNPRANNPPQNVNRGTSHIFFKTRICAKFIEGTCKNGDNCSFAHGPHDLREPPPNWQDLIRDKEKDRVLGNGNWGGGVDDQRMIVRMKICKKYYNGGECPYGDKCSFFHERPFAPPLKKLKGDFAFEQRESSVISIGLIGDKGSVNDFDQFRKTKMCSKWEMGQCPFGGERCHFAHGQSDLRISGLFNGADVVINTDAISRKPLQVSPLVIGGAPLSAEEEQKKTLKWKLNKKINRIYADWLDDLTPPSKDDI